MKQQLISRLVVGALAAIAANAAFAGQIQASSVSIAHEVITDDTQAVNSPSISYRFAGDVDARAQDQTFQVQFHVQAGKWDNPGAWVATGVEGTAPAAALPSITMTDGVSAAYVKSGSTAGLFEVTKLALDSTGTILYATITVHQDPAALIKQPIITLSAANTAGITGGNANPQVSSLYSVVGPVAACTNGVPTLKVDFKHYVALTSPNTLATDSNATPDEHKRGGTNDATLISFPTNIGVKVTKAQQNAKLDVTSNSTAFTADNTTPAGATSATVFDSYVSAQTVNLGSVYVSQIATGYDTDLANQYALLNAGSDTGIVNAAVANGAVEAKDVKVTVTADQGFAVGSSLKLAAHADGTGVFYTHNFGTAAAAAATSYTFTANAAGDLAKFYAAAGPEAGVYVIYSVPVGNTNVIPASSFTVSAATVEKAPDAGATFFTEQPESCNGSLYSLGGSIKIDVRNFGSAGRTDGWKSVLRLINTSESRTATVYGQYIGADGKYGNWGKVTTLSPRAAVNLTADQVEAALTSVAAAPSGNAAAGQGGASGAANSGAIDSNGTAGRLRLTTTDGNTLRVQNYLYNTITNNFIEVSGSQGVDFDGTVGRAQDAGTRNSQDAQAGINAGN